MKEVAEQTGGEVLAGNDVRARSDARWRTDRPITRSLTRRLEVTRVKNSVRSSQVNRTGVKLAYRPGYFPSGRPEGEPPKAHPLIVAMQPGVPASTSHTADCRSIAPGQRQTKKFDQLHHRIGALNSPTLRSTRASVMMYRRGFHQRGGASRANLEPR